MQGHEGFKTYLKVMPNRLDTAAFSIRHSTLPFHEKGLLIHLSIFCIILETRKLMGREVKKLKWLIQDLEPGLSPRPMFSSAELCPLQWDHLYPSRPLPISFLYLSLRVGW